MTRAPVRSMLFPVFVLVLAGCASSRLRIEVLGFADCPNTPVVGGNVEKAVASLGLAADVVYVDQERLPAGDPRRGWPAPTVLVDGRDLFGLPAPQGAQMGCRMYPRGIPTPPEIAEALRSRSRP